MNFFEFYGIEPDFELDQAKLKKKFLLKSKELHPDFNTDKETSKQLEILELAALNNKAYKTLKNQDSRYRYILELNKILFVEGKEIVPQEFLMEMMDINEVIMDLQFDYDESTYNKAKATVENIVSQLQLEIESITNKITKESILDDTKFVEEKKSIKFYLLKRKYIQRLAESISKINQLL